MHRGPEADTYRVPCILPTLADLLYNYREQAKQGYRSCRACVDLAASALLPAESALTVQPSCTSCFVILVCPSRMRA